LLSDLVLVVVVVLQQPQDQLVEVIRRLRAGRVLPRHPQRRVHTLWEGGGGEVRHRACSPS
jgi:hypothetical protein